MSKMRRGEPLSFEAAVNHILAGGWVYLHHKAYHPAWSQHWSLARIKQATDYGVLDAAYHIEQETKSK